MASFLVQFLANYVSTHFDVIAISIVGHLKTLQGTPFICGVIIAGSLILLIRTLLKKTFQEPTSPGNGLPRKRRGFRLVFEFFF
nr:hypothetical protein [Thermococcus sp. IRI33]